MDLLKYGRDGKEGERKGRRKGKRGLSGDWPAETDGKLE